jgi:hypothetical protein
MRTITTSVYTLDELKALGDSRAVERARDWVREGTWDADDITEQLAEALREAYGSDATVTEWDYGRGQSVTIGGTLARPAETGEGPAFRGWRLPSGGYDATPRDAEITTEWPAAGDALVIGTYSERWQDSDESWSTVTDEHHDACESYVREIESVLSRIMTLEVEYRSSDEYADELAEMNEWSFTDTGERFG